MKHLFFIIICTFFSATCLAQNNNDKARAEFNKATQAFTNNSFQESITGLNNAITLLGASNVRIQFLLTKSYFGLSDFQQAKVEIQKYFDLNPPADEGYSEMLLLTDVIDKKIELQIKEKQQAVADNLAWENAVEKNTLESYQQYLSAFPTGKNNSNANELVVKLSAIKLNTNASYREYIRKYPNGAFVKQAKEEASYLKATESGLIKDYEDYNTSYPSGKYISNSTNFLESEYFDFAEDFFDKKEYENAKKYYNKSLETFPDGKNSSTIQDRLQQIKQIYIDIENKKKLDERLNLQKLGDKYRTDATNLYLKGTAKLIFGLAAVCGGSYLVVNELGKEDGDMLISLLGAGLLGLGIIPLYTSIDDDFPRASNWSSASKEYYRKANAITLSFRPVLNPYKKTFGLAFSFNF
jgi:tetratricopeptide (TPR) repeat protein